MTLNWLVSRKLAKAYEYGGVFAYPTEAVYGLGCNPWLPRAVNKIYEIKARPRHKGLIICASNIQQLAPFLANLSKKHLEILNSAWPGAHTFVVPLPENHPWPWLSSSAEPSIALRVSAHPVVQAICSKLGPIVSTSANPAGLPPAKHHWQVRKYFAYQLDCVVSGAVGDLKKPTPVTDLITGRSLRR